MEKSFITSRALYVLIGLLFVAQLVMVGCVPKANDLSVVEDQVKEGDSVESDHVESAPFEENATGNIQNPAPESVIESDSEPVVQPALYKDGSYFKIGDYQNPAGPETVTVQIQLENDKIKHVAVGIQDTHPTTKNFQTLFSQGIGAVVIGKSIDSLSVGATNGSSLTPVGFNAALDAIRAEARQ